MNYYEILQITPDASDEVVKAAYKALVKKYHPDNGVINGTEKIQLVNEAYKILSDPYSRKIYDERLRSSKEQSDYKDNSFKRETDEEYKSENIVRSESQSYNQAESEPKSKLGSAMQAFFRGVSHEVQRNQQIEENAYYDGLNMNDYELVHAFKKNYGLKRHGYARALEEREFLTRDYDGKLIPTDKFRHYWR